MSLNCLSSLRAALERLALGSSFRVRLQHLRWPHAQIEHVTSCLGIGAHHSVRRGCPKSVIYGCTSTHGLLQVWHVFWIVLKIHRLVVFLVHSIILSSPVPLGHRTSQPRSVAGRAHRVSPFLLQPMNLCPAIWYSFPGRTGKQPPVGLFQGLART